MARKFAAVEVADYRYVFAHGHAPRGFGAWMFENDNRQVVVQHSGMFSDAKRVAIAWARQNGAARVHVAT